MYCLNSLKKTPLCFSANVKKACQLKEPQEFWTDSSTKILVPMMSVTGLFQYKRDARKHFSITTIPLTKNALLVLVQPINGNDLNTIESEISLQSSDWLQDLSPRYILNIHAISNKSY